MKVAIIGAGNVGGLSAMRIAEEGIADVVLVDVAKGLALAKAHDEEDAHALVGPSCRIQGSEDSAAIRGSDIVVVAAGLARKPGMTREDLLKKNYAILKEISSAIKKYTPQAIVIVVSNPLDTMTYVVLKETGFEKQRVFGMGASLDSSRFANLISQKLNVSPSSIKALVIGTHGETMIPLPRLTTVKGKPLTELLLPDEVASLVQATKNRGAYIVSLYGTGSAYIAPSAAIAELVRTIAENKHTTIPVSTFLEGEYGSSDVCIGVPAGISALGINSIVELELNEEENKLFQESVSSTRQNIGILYKTPTNK